MCRLLVRSGLALANSRIVEPEVGFGASTGTRGGFAL